MPELVVRGGTLVDGTGTPARTADVAIDGGRIVEVGQVSAKGDREIDADGALVTPGFVDVHTHYDGQATWDPLLTPSCWHGVTTVVMGNCGVGFAPCHPDKREWVVELMEGVEDIPGAALSAGIRWSWETFPEYLDALDRTAKALDIGTQVPHGTVRAYVMGERGANNEPATPQDIAAMARLVVEGMEAGALGVSTSRTIMHAAITGEPVPGTFAAEDELFGLGEALMKVGRGVFELAPAGALGEDMLAAEREMAWACKLGAHIGRPISFACNQVPTDPDEWRRLLDLAEAAVADGADVRPQVHARTVSLLIGLGTFHPLMWCEPWAEVAGLPHDQLVAVLRRPEVKERFLPGLSVLDDPNFGFQSPTRLFQLGDPPDYEPEPSESLANRAARAGRDPAEYLYDMLLEHDGHELLNSPILNYSNGSLDPTFEMLTSPITTFGLSDGGAHAGQTCDASATTFLLSHWSRDRTRGSRIPIEDVVAKMTSKTAALYGLGDRGTVAPGYVGDLNIIDYERLQLHRPEVAHDLPGDAKRLIQRADGYIATIKGGHTLMEEGEDTGLRTGSLLRGPR